MIRSSIKYARSSNVLSRRSFSSLAALETKVNALYQEQRTSEFPELNKSFMKVLDGEIDKDSD